MEEREREEGGREKERERGGGEIDLLCQHKPFSQIRISVNTSLNSTSRAVLVLLSLLTKSHGNKHCHDMNNPTTHRNILFPFYRGGGEERRTDERGGEVKKGQVWRG